MNQTPYTFAGGGGDTTAIEADVAALDVRVTAIENNFDEDAEDAVGGILTNTTTINFTYNDAGNTISASVNALSIDAAQLAANAVTDAKLRQSAGVSVIGRSANSTGNVADITASADDRFLARTGGALSFTQLTNGMVPTNTVGLNKLANATQRAIVSASGAGAWAEQAVSANVLSLLQAADYAAIRTLLAKTGFVVAYRTGSQTVTAGANNKVQCNVELADAAGWYDNATNYRYTAQRSGWYIVIGGVYSQGNSSDTGQALIYKNGSRYTQGTYVNNNVTGSFALETVVVGLVYLNGTTDYVELYHFTPSGVTTLSASSDGSGLFFAIAPLEQNV